LKRTGHVLVIIFLLFGFNLPVTGFAKASVQQQYYCPPYELNLLVDFVDSNPHIATWGTTVVTIVHVVYPDGSPVKLSPETVSFAWSMGATQIVFENATVLPTTTPGYYRYTQEITDRFPRGTFLVSVLMCSCSDGEWNYGPPGVVNSPVTATTSDDSIVVVGVQSTTTITTTTAVTVPGIPLTTYMIASIIAILLLAALILFITHARRKRNT